MLISSEYGRGHLVYLSIFFVSGACFMLDCLFSYTEILVLYNCILVGYVHLNHSILLFFCSFEPKSKKSEVLLNENMRFLLFCSICLKDFGNGFGKSLHGSMLQNSLVLDLNFIGRKISSILQSLFVSIWLFS